MHNNHIFLHLPKTGGMTLRHYIYDNFGEDEYFFIKNDRNQTLKESLDEYADKNVFESAEYKWYLGHFGYGIHKYINRDNLKYVAMLREPVDRVLSNYFFVLSIKHHKWYKMGFKDSMSLKDIYESRFHMALFNYQTRILSSDDGFPVDLKKKPQLDEGDLEKAIKHIDNAFALVGVMEDFNGFMDLGVRKEIFPHSEYRVMNVNKTRLTNNEIEPDLIETVRENNKLDKALYEYVKAKFEAEKKKYKL